MATSKPSAQLKEKAASAHPPARKPLNRSSSDTASKAAKTIPHATSTATATATPSKSRLPAKKPAEKPPSPSRQPLKPASATTSTKEKAAKSSSTVSRAASSSSKPPASSSERATKTLKAGAIQSSARAKSPGNSVVPRRKETDATTPKTGEESCVAAEKIHKEAEIHVKEHDSVSVASSDCHMSDDEHSHDAIVQKVEKVTEADEVNEEEKVEKVVEASNEKSAAEEKVQQDEPSSPKQEPDGAVNDGEDLDREETLAAEITEAPRGEEPCEIQMIEPKVEENNENKDNQPCKTEVTSEEVENKPVEDEEAPAVDSSSNEHATEKIEAEAAGSKSAEPEQGTSSATEASTSAEVVPEKKTVDDEKLGGVQAFRKPAVVQAKKEAVPSNDVIEVTRSKLLERKKSKVLALVGAFETVMSLQEEGGQDASSAKE